MQHLPFPYRNVVNTSKSVESMGIYLCNSFEWLTSPLLCANGLASARRNSGEASVASCTWELPISGKTSTKHEINKNRCHKIYHAVFPGHTLDLTTRTCSNCGVEGNQGEREEALQDRSQMVRIRGQAGPECFTEVNSPWER